MWVERLRVARVAAVPVGGPGVSICLFACLLACLLACFLFPSLFHVVPPPPLYSSVFLTHVACPAHSPSLAANKVDKVRKLEGSSGEGDGAQGGAPSGEEEGDDGASFDLEEAMQIAKEFNVPLHQTSAVTGEGIQELFTSLVARAMENDAAASAAAIASVSSAGDEQNQRGVGRGGGGSGGDIGGAGASMRNLTSIRLDEGGGATGRGACCY